MVLETFRGHDLAGALASVRAHLGDDALLLRTRPRREHGGAVVEVVATTAYELESFRARLERAPTRLAPTGTGRRPHVVALVGPTGAGKTTSAIKLALHPDAFGDRSVGVITLDTYRVGALEQLQTYAEIAQLPLEVVYGPADLAGALERLQGVDVILVDTPGRSPADPAASAWRNLLRGLRPDEVHLVLPAGVRTEVALWARELFASCGPTHLFLSKLDEVPGEVGVAELADELGFPTRWVATGQEVPLDLHPAVPRILAALCRDNDGARPRGIAV
jgi:flagellar biosynthesis protein FlhF